MLEGNYIKRPFKVSGDLDCIKDHRIYIGCSKGVWMVENGTVYSLSESRSVYGITFDDAGNLWAAQRKGNHMHRSRITEEGMSGFDYVMDLRCLDTFWRKGIHQIDFVDDDLFVCDTYNNRILVVQVFDGGRIGVHRVLYPMGRHRPSHDLLGDENYKHFNSVYRHGDILYLMAHNDTIKTKKPSEIYLLDRYTLKTVGILENIGVSTHNIVVDFTGKMYICDSGNHVLIVYDGIGVVEVWKDDVHETFLRGLAINDDVTVIGGSVRTPDASNDDVDGFLFVLDKKKQNLLCTLEIEGCGQIHEVRMAGLDYGLSNTWRKPE